MIPYGKQSVSEEDISAVVDVLRSDFLTCGPRVEQFEQAFADYCGVKHAVSCSNGTAALHLAMLAGEIGPGDRVVTCPITFLASANAGRFVGAEVEFCDAEPVATTLDPGQLEATWSENTRAVVAVDFAGHPANNRALAEICHSRGALLINDACHAIGGSVPDRETGEWFKVGGLPWVDMTTFSFHPVKTMTTGEGGMVTTNSDELAARLRLLRNHGMVRDPENMTAFGNPGPLNEVGPWAYEMQELGYNYRLTDIQCALGMSQLKRLDEFVERRSEIVSMYNRAFDDCPHVSVPVVAPWARSSDGRERISWHLYAVRIDYAKIGKQRSEVMANLMKQGVGTQVHYIPVNLQPYYRKDSQGTDFSDRFPNCHRFYEQCISLPLFPAMSDEDVNTVVESIRSLGSDSSLM